MSNVTKALAQQRADIRTGEEPPPATSFEEAMFDFANAASKAIWAPCTCPICTATRAITWPFRSFARLFR